MTQVSTAHTLPAMHVPSEQQASPGPPHDDIIIERWQMDPAPHTNAPSHTPLQHARPRVPHGSQRPARQVYPDAHAPPGQHAIPTAPHSPESGSGGAMSAAGASKSTAVSIGLVMSSPFGASVGVTSAALAASPSSLLASAQPTATTAERSNRSRRNRIACVE